MKCFGVVEKACDKDRKTFNGRFGMSNLKQNFNPLPCVKPYKKVVLLSVLYGCELWNNLTVSDMSSLRKMKHYSLKRIQNLRTFTRSGMVESLVGLVDIIFEIDKKNFFSEVSVKRHEFISGRLFPNRLYTFTFGKKDVQDFVPDL